MRKFASVLFIVLFSLVSINTFAASAHSAQSKAQPGQTVDLYFFWSKDCPHCVAAHPFIDKLKAQYPGLRVHSFEASSNSKNIRLFERMAKQHGREPGYFPTFFIGNKMIVGYTSADTTGQEIRNAINASRQ